MAMNKRSTVKSLKPLFAQKLDYEFAHMDLRLTLRVSIKGVTYKEIIEADRAIQNIDLLKGVTNEVVTVEVEIQYEGG